MLTVTPNVLLVETVVITSCTLVLLMVTDPIMMSSRPVQMQRLDKLLKLNQIVLLVCRIINYTSLYAHLQYSCISESNAFCGNQIREGDEDCDCGSSDADTCASIDPCCEPGECRLKMSANCR